MKIKNVALPWCFSQVSESPTRKYFTPCVAVITKAVSWGRCPVLLSIGTRVAWSVDSVDSIFFVSSRFHVVSPSRNLCWYNYILTNPHFATAIHGYPRLSISTGSLSKGCKLRTRPSETAPWCWQVSPNESKPWQGAEVPAVAMEANLTSFIMFHTSLRKIPTWLKVHSSHISFSQLDVSQALNLKYWHYTNQAPNHPPTHPTSSKAATPLFYLQKPKAATNLNSSRCLSTLFTTFRCLPSTPTFQRWDHLDSRIPVIEFSGSELTKSLPGAESYPWTRDFRRKTTGFVCFFGCFQAPWWTLGSTDCQVGVWERQLSIRGAAQ